MRRRAYLGQGGGRGVLVVLDAVWGWLRALGDTLAEVIADLD